MPEGPFPPIMPDPAAEEASHSGARAPVSPRPQRPLRERRRSAMATGKNAALHYKCNETLFYYNAMAFRVMRPGTAPFPPACLPRQSHAAHSEFLK